MQTVQADVRDALLDEALARSGGSQRRAAKLLSISRQLLHYLLRRR
jgi:DNA-binding protein Fis